MRSRRSFQGHSMDTKCPKVMHLKRCFLCNKPTKKFKKKKPESLGYPQFWSVPSVCPYLGCPQNVISGDIRIFLGVSLRIPLTPEASTATQTCSLEIQLPSTEDCSCYRCNRHDPSIVRQDKLSRFKVLIPQQIRFFCEMASMKVTS
eukprot:g77213.t1